MFFFKIKKKILKKILKIKSILDNLDGEIEEADDFTKNSSQETIMTYFKIIPTKMKIQKSEFLKVEKGRIKHKFDGTNKLCNWSIKIR